MKALKWVGIVIGVFLVIFVGMFSIGYNMMTHGQAYLEEKGGLNVQYVGNANEYIYCKGQGSAMAYMVNSPETGERNVFAVCVSATGEVTEGK